MAGRIKPKFPGITWINGSRTESIPGVYIVLGSLGSIGGHEDPEDSLGGILIQETFSKSRSCSVAWPLSLSRV